MPKAVMYLLVLPLSESHSPVRAVSGPFLSEEAGQESSDPLLELKCHAALKTDKKSTFDKMIPQYGFCSDL